MHKEAIDFGLTNLDKNTKGSFLEDLMDQCMEGEMEQTSLIILDFMITDFVFHKHGLTSTHFKSALSAFGVQNDEEFGATVSKIAAALKQIS